jgi:molecular chaperone DnaK (HSP70)
VVEGEHEIAAYNTRLGMIELAGLRRVPRGVPRIEVSADVDVNGSATVSATDLDTGRGQTLPITWESIETYRAAPPLPAPRPTVIARRAPDGP